MIILSAKNLDMFEAEIKATIQGNQDLHKEKIQDYLTKIGIPVYDKTDSPLVRYCRYLHEQLELPFQQPNHEAVNDILFYQCGTSLLWTLA